MKRRGFTLIELLAVIVVLAIIALIATPIVLNLIDKAKVGAAESSSTAYIKSVENAVVSSMLTTNLIQDGTYSVGEIEANVNGTTPTKGNFTLEKGQVKKADLCINNYRIVYENYKSTRNGTCDEIEATPKVCQLINGNALEIGSEYECTVREGETKTFYVLEVTEKNVSLIMNQNIDNTTFAYCDQNGSNPSNGQLCQADGAKAKLPTTWANVDQVSLPTGEQIANAGGLTTWTDGGSYITGLPTWLYNYLDGTANSVSDVYGYWTSTPYSSNSSNAWSVDYYGYLYYNNVYLDNRYGVRPVITISKSKI